MLPSGIDMHRHAYQLNKSNNKKRESLLIIYTTSEFTHKVQEKYLYTMFTVALTHNSPVMEPC